MRFGSQQCADCLHFDWGFELSYGDYKAKKTYYGGTMFDSNLEAKTAQALDALGVKWSFHEVCFRDSDFPYGQYTPDFHLEERNAFVEVAGVFDERHKKNVYTLCKILGSESDDPCVIVVDGNGDMSGYFVEDGALKFRTAAFGDGRTSNLFEAAQVM